MDRVCLCRDGSPKGVHASAHHRLPLFIQPHHDDDPLSCGSIVALLAGGGIAETLEQRLEAIACDASQVPVIVRFPQDFRDVMTSFAREVGGELGPAERFWPISGRGLP